MVTVRDRMGALLARETKREEALQAFDGAVLSDAGLTLHGHDARFSMFLSDQLGSAPHLDWLVVISEYLELLGAGALLGYPRPCQVRRKNGTIYSGHRLITRTCPFFSSQHDRWYCNGIKEVPYNLIITPVTLAHWFMGDGGSSWKGLVAVDVSLATFSFGHNSIETLRTLLGESGIRTLVRTDKRKKEGYNLSIVIAQNSVDRFMNMVRPYIVPSFRYKLKFRRGRHGNATW